MSSPQERSVGVGDNGILPTDPLAGVVDPDFKEFLTYTREHLIPVEGGDGLYDLNKTLWYTTARLNPNTMHKVLLGNIAMHDVATLVALKREGFLKTEKIPTKGTSFLAAGERDIMFAASFIYAKYKVRSSGEKEAITLTRLRKMQELWGDNPRAEEIKVLVDKIEAEGFVHAKKAHKEPDSPTSRIPEKNDEFRKYDSKTLGRISEVAKINFPRWDTPGNEIYVYPKDLGLSFEVVKAIEFARYFRGWRAYNNMPTNDKFLLTEVLLCMDFCIRQIKAAENHYLRAHPGEARAPHYSLYGLVESCKKTLEDERN